MLPAHRWIDWLIAAMVLLAAVPAAAQGKSFSVVAEAPSAPALVLNDIDDRKFDLASLRGRVVVVNFWATWCPPCRKEFPSLGRLQKLFKPQDLTVVAVNVGEDADTIFSFAGNTDIAVLLDRDSRAMAGWRVGGLPATYVVDRGGRIVLRAVGGREFDSPAILEQLRPLTERK
jgi:thiol-disulfide isomerase/thioredoxin